MSSMEALRSALFTCGQFFKENSYIVTNFQDENNPIIYANDHFYDLSGYREEEVLGKNCRFMQGPDTNSETVEMIRQAIRSGTSLSCDLINYKKDGSKFLNRLCIMPIHHEVGGLAYYVGFQKNIDVQKETKVRTGSHAATNIANPFENIFHISRSLTYLAGSSGPDAEGLKGEIYGKIKVEVDQIADYINSL